MFIASLNLFGSTPPFRDLLLVGEGDDDCGSLWLVLNFLILVISPVSPLARLSILLLALLMTVAFSSAD